MHFPSQKIVAGLLGATVFVSASAFAQSLGEAAREQRQKQAAKTAAPRKVLTNEDISASADTSSSPPAPPNTLTLPSSSSTQTSAGEFARTAEKWKALILERKKAVASFQSQIEKAKGSIQFVEANAYSNGPQYNQEMARRMEEVHRGEKRLEEEKKKLEELQEAARKAGFGSSVYDP